MYKSGPTLKSQLWLKQQFKLRTNNTATNPEYKSSDDKNQPYTITADHGRETSPEIIDLTNPKMVMSLTTGEVVTLTSATGRLNKVTNNNASRGKGDVNTLSRVCFGNGSSLD